MATRVANVDLLSEILTKTIVEGPTAGGPPDPIVHSSSRFHSSTRISRTAKVCLLRLPVFRVALRGPFLDVFVLWRAFPRPSFEPKSFVNPFTLVSLPLSHNLNLPLDLLRRNRSWLQALPTFDLALSMETIS